jgi:hypothetical protein
VPSLGLTWLTCSEASNNSIAGFDPFGGVHGNFGGVHGNGFDGLRVLCAPHPCAAAAAAVASGSSLHSDLRDNELKELPVEDFLEKALQLETLYAAANACRAHRTIGFMARRLAGGNALYCGTNTVTCGVDETLTIRSRATRMYAPVSAGAAATHG